MDEKQVLFIQKRFSEFHRYFAIVLLVFNFSFVFQHSLGVTEIAAIAGIIILIVLEFLLFSSDKLVIRSWKFQIFRYLQLLVSIFFLMKYDNPYQYGLAFFVMCVFSIEYYFTFDYSDKYYMGLYTILLGIPLMISAIMYNFQTTLTVNSDIIKVLIFYVGYIVFANISATIVSKILCENDEKVFRHRRDLERSKEINEELKIQQQKIRVTNELLGTQKIQLESAYNKINSVNKEKTIQNEMLKYISSSLDINKLMPLITDAIINEIGVDVCAIILYPDLENNRKKLKYKIRSRLGTTFIANLSDAIEGGLLDSYLSANGTYVDNHVEERKYVFLKRGLIGSMLMVPLMDEDKVKGGLFVAHPKYEYFTDNREFFEGIVAQFVIALKNSNMFSKMEDMAIRDGLTGIFNRRHLTNKFNEAVSEAILKHEPLSVALFDIDHFKRVNDTYGHLFGDEVIKTVARFANDVAEEHGGFAGRYGGEEFVLVFPQKGLNVTLDFIKTLHQEIQEKELEHNGEKVFIHVSVGLTSYPETCKDPAELLNHADWSMYYSKENGRNRITIDSEEVLAQVLIK